MNKRAYGKWLLSEANDPTKWGRYKNDGFTIKHLPSGGELWMSNAPCDTDWYERCAGGMPPVPWLYRGRLRRAIHRMLRSRATSGTPTPEPQ